MTLQRPDALAILDRMLLIRRFDEAVIDLGQRHKEVGRNHASIGNEAVEAPAMALLRPGDLVHTTHRNHGSIVARGVDLGRAFAEILGRADGLCGGKGGSFHLCERSAGFGPTSAIVGGALGLSVGSALALKKAGRGNVSVALFGDGALDEGIAFEALNFVAYFCLPVLLLCENNSVTGERVQTSMLAAKQLTDVPAALGIACTQVDGGDVEAVHAELERALAQIRATGGPVFIEAKLERWPGAFALAPEFSTGITDLTACWDGTDGGAYSEWIAVDPIFRFVRSLLAHGVTPAEIERRDAAVRERIDAATRFAEASPFPSTDTAVTAVRA